MTPSPVQQTTRRQEGKRAAQLQSAQPSPAVEVIFDGTRSLSFRSYEEWMLYISVKVDVNDIFQARRKGQATLEVARRENEEGGDAGRAITEKATKGENANDVVHEPKGTSTTAQETVDKTLGLPVAVSTGTPVHSTIHSTVHSTVHPTADPIDDLTDESDGGESVVLLKYIPAPINVNASDDKVEVQGAPPAAAVGEGVSRAGKRSTDVTNVSAAKRQRRSRKP